MRGDTDESMLAGDTQLFREYKDNECDIESSNVSISLLDVNRGNDQEMRSQGPDDIEMRSQGMNENITRNEQVPATGVNLHERMSGVSSENLQ